nr:hypothetical protein [uncultured Nitrososphaera sp.]
MGIKNNIDEAFEAAAGAVDSKAAGTKAPRTSWVGQIVLKCPATLEMEYQLYNVKGAKAVTTTQAETSPVLRVDKNSRRAIEGKYVGAAYTYDPNFQGEERTLLPVSYEELKERVRFNRVDGTQWPVSIRSEKKYFVSEELAAGNFVEVRPEDIIHVQDGEEVGMFERTKTIELEDENVISLQQLPQYKVKDYYMLKANVDPKVGEKSFRVADLASKLYEKKIGILCFFSFGRGYEYYTAIVFPHHDAEADKTWLVLALTEGIVRFDSSWAVRFHDDLQPTAPKMVQPAKKAKVKLARAAGGA